MAAIDLFSKSEVPANEDFVRSERVPLDNAEVTTSSYAAFLGPLQRYRIVSPLGKGGMAEVFLAAWEVAPNSHRPVVIKRLYAHLGDDPNLVQMFIDEARLACELEHENIVKTIEVGVIDGRCCIAMEHLAGQPLQQLLREGWARGGVPVDVALHIAIRALDGLGYAHEHRDHRGEPLGIVHRDISPHNIFITNNGQVKLLDFGIAKATGRESRTATGYIKGKLAYIAPEQARAEAVDRRADIWSVGVVLWELLSGARLFRADTDAATLAATLDAEIVPPSTRRSIVTPELDRIVMRALRRDVKERYPTAWAMKRDLEQFAARSSTRANSAMVSQLMHEYFGKQIAEQQKTVFDLRERQIAAPLPVPPSQTPTVVRREPLAVETTAPSISTVGYGDVLSQNHRLIVRAIVMVLLLTAVVGGTAIYLLVVHLRKSEPTDPIRPSTAKPALAAPNNIKPIANLPVVPTPPAVELSSGAPSNAMQAPSLVTSVKDHLEHNVTSTVQSARTRSIAPVHTTASSPPAPDAQVAETGMLNLDSSPWSVVIAEGRVLGQTPLMGVRLTAGSHVLTLRNPDLGIETQYTVNIEAGKTVARRVGLQ